MRMKELALMCRKVKVDLLSCIRETHWNIEIGNISDCRNCILHICHLVGLITCQNETEMFFGFFFWVFFCGIATKVTFLQKLRGKHVHVLSYHLKLRRSANGKHFKNAAFTGAHKGTSQKAK